MDGEEFGCKLGMGCQCDHRFRLECANALDRREAPRIHLVVDNAEKVEGDKPIK